MSALIVVEGASDQIAVEALAERRGVALAPTGVKVVSLGGAHRIANFLEQLDPRPTRLVFLCDAGEETVFRSALDRTGVSGELFVCDADLEDELIRALGVPAVEEVVRASGDLNRFRKLQHMPQWRGRDAGQQLRRFMAAGARRKLRYARSLVDALDLERVPRPLDNVLACALRDPQ